ncbi:hypothetical protein CWI75_05525 [Kineobactrum sediminis]|uniref:YhdP central domain-containing protein n=1 Tax=Kineobactrum sediminis TaxID=1905677 RepID=A0A2N5Y3D0_9GAMM|nr:DUF3971 domain-containing protein [Kineobactrum sediminis]PLW82902.1 hypothetical protein CWI75_05525 [Kineobactrum sediminis]
MPLADINKLLLHSGSLSPALTEAMAELAPIGSLATVELRLEDVRAPLRSWEVEANFDELGLSAWRGVPGITGATGYLQLAEGAGEIVLDSQQLALDFPLIYRRQLAYQDIYGTIDFAWDTAGLRLHSGLLTAVGVEGTAHALLGLNIPFQSTDTGIEMDLLVGLSDSDVSYRSRYLPYRLNPGLLTWLETALQGGTVNTGAFLWRGSLRRGATTQRTVQLFFDVSDSELLYDPRWPPVSDLDGTVLVDDLSISVWADRARLYEAQLARLSAEAWRDTAGTMRLAVAAGLAGSAGDGLRVLRESPLGLPLKGALANWQAQGELEGEFQLELALARAAQPPAVAFRATLADAAVSINPGNLDLEALNGTVSYDSATGFHSENLSARLWGQPLALGLQPLPRTDTATPGELAPVAVEFATTVRAAALGDWLGWSVPREIADGATDVSGSLAFGAAGAPRLQLQSDLQGVRLALPETWGKTANERLPLRVQATLGETPLRLDIEAERQWQLSLDVASGGVQGAVLALQQGRPHAPVPGQLRVSGHAALIDVAPWQALLAGLPATTNGVPLQLSIEDLQIDSLRVWGQHLTDVILNLEQRPERWQLDLETGWLQGQGHFDREFTRGELALSFLDLKGLTGGSDKTPQLELDKLLGLPTVAVSIDQLYRAGEPLGSLDFVLAPEADSLRAQNITGELFGLRMARDKPASLTWNREGTLLEADLAFADLGDTLAALAYERIVETRSGEFQLEVQWPGSPGQFSLGSSTGSLLVDVAAGRFLTASAGASGTLRVVSILNLAEIVQRLSLTQLFESGIPFTSMNGEMYLHGGEIEVPRMNVAGAATGFRFTALSSVAERTINGELVATLPVANNLAWVAALTAGLPIAAGVFVVSKLFEKQVTQLSSAVYRIGGTWDEPSIEFDRIFDSGDGYTPTLPVEESQAPAQSPLLPRSPVSIISPEPEAASSSSRK